MNKPKINKNAPKTDEEHNLYKALLARSFKVQCSVYSEATARNTFSANSKIKATFSINKVEESDALDTSYETFTSLSVVNFSDSLSKKDPETKKFVKEYLAQNPDVIKPIRQKQIRVGFVKYSDSNNKLPEAFVLMMPNPQLDSNNQHNGNWDIQIVLNIKGQNSVLFDLPNSHQVWKPLDKVDKPVFDKETEKWTTTKKENTNSTSTLIGNAYNQVPDEIYNEDITDEDYLNNI